MRIDDKNDDLFIRACKLLRQEFEKGNQEVQFGSECENPHDSRSRKWFDTIQFRELKIAIHSGYVQYNELATFNDTVVNSFKLLYRENNEWQRRLAEEEKQKKLRAEEETRQFLINLQRRDFSNLLNTLEFDVANE